MRLAQDAGWRTEWCGRGILAPTAIHSTTTARTDGSPIPLPPCRFLSQDSTVGCCGVTIFTSRRATGPAGTAACAEAWGGTTAAPAPSPRCRRAGRGGELCHHSVGRRRRPAAVRFPDGGRPHGSADSQAYGCYRVLTRGFRLCHFLGPASARAMHGRLRHRVRGVQRAAGVATGDVVARRCAEPRRLPLALSLSMPAEPSG